VIYWKKLQRTATAQGANEVLGNSATADNLQHTATTATNCNTLQQHRVPTGHWAIPQLLIQGLLLLP